MEDVTKAIMEIDWERHNDQFKKEVDEFIITTHGGGLIESGITPMQYHSWVTEKWHDMGIQN